MFLLRSPSGGINLRQLLWTPQLRVSDAAPALVMLSWLIFQSISVLVFMFTLSLLLFSHCLLAFSFVLGEVLPSYKHNVFHSLPRLVFDMPTFPTGQTEQCSRFYDSVDSISTRIIYRKPDMLSIALLYQFRACCDPVIRDQRQFHQQGLRSINSTNQRYTLDSYLLSP